MSTLSITQRVEALRQWMRQENLDAFIVPSNDSHNSEYPAPYWQCRAWISGFDGSAGTAVITLTDAALWTDSRYFLQAEQQLSKTPFRLMREGTEATPTIAAWLSEQVAQEHSAQPLRVGGTAATFLTTDFCRIEEAARLTAVATPDPFEQLWSDRPALPCTPVYTHDRWAGEEVEAKIRRVWTMYARETMQLDFALVCDLSEISWLLNLRASDVAYNPVFHAYFLLHAEGGHLFTDVQRLSPAIVERLCSQGIALHPYDGLEAFVAEHSPLRYRYALPPTISQQLEALMNVPEGKAVECNSVVAKARAHKNATELAGFRRACQHDGVALVKFLRWLDEMGENTVASETEHTIAQRLEDFRSAHPDYIGCSFATIAGYAANGAIVHYEPQPDSAAQLCARGLLLLDSGAQYHCGTTDITRTISLGTLTDEERRAYTLVLKGHIALSRMRFPCGTVGLQLDTAARYAMWQAGYDFGHGTGHGVGAHLCVHEGPFQIRKDHRAATIYPFSEGMVVTNEPGIYVAGQFGVRIENILTVTEAETTDFGRFHRFETLTLCPYDTRPIVRSMLNAEELQWLNAYHAQVRTTLLPLLIDEADRAWLKRATATLA